MQKLSEYAKQVIEETISYLIEILDKEKHLPYKSDKIYGHTLWRFYDPWKQEHLLKLKKGILNFGIGVYYEIEFGVNMDGVPSFDIPEMNDPRVYNTHIKIISDEIINKRNDINVYRFPPVEDDPVRKRLFLSAMNKYLDKNVWEVFDNLKDSMKNSLWIKRKTA